MLRSDSLILEVGKVGSVFYSYWAELGHQYQEKKLKELESQPEGQRHVDMRDYPLRNVGSEQVIYKNYGAGIITLKDMIISDEYFYTDSLNLFSWTLAEDTMTINGYLCQKAETDFRGRHYIAWFTSQVPVQDGPYKFNGLPGLIVSIQDSQATFRIALQSFEKFNGQKEITLNTDHCTPITRAKLREIKKAYFEDPFGYMNAQGKGYITFDSGTPPVQKKRNYNPMELE